MPATKDKKSVKSKLKPICDQKEGRIFTDYSSRVSVLRNNDLLRTVTAPADLASSLKKIFKNTFSCVATREDRLESPVKVDVENLAHLSQISLKRNATLDKSESLISNDDDLSEITKINSVDGKMHQRLLNDFEDPVLRGTCGGLGSTSSIARKKLRNVEELSIEEETNAPAKPPKFLRSKSQDFMIVDSRIERRQTLPSPTNKSKICFDQDEFLNDVNFRELLAVKDVLKSYSRFD